MVPGTRKAEPSPPHEAVVGGRHPARPTPFSASAPARRQAYAKDLQRSRIGVGWRGHGARRASASPTNDRAPLHLPARARLLPGSNGGRASTRREGRTVRPTERWGHRPWTTVSPCPLTARGRRRGRHRCGHVGGTPAEVGTAAPAASSPRHAWWCRRAISSSRRCRRNGGRATAVRAPGHKGARRCGARCPTPPRSPERDVGRREDVAHDVRVPRLGLGEGGEESAQTAHRLDPARSGTPARRAASATSSRAGSPRPRFRTPRRTSVVARSGRLRGSGGRGPGGCVRRGCRRRGVQRSSSTGARSRVRKVRRRRAAFVSALPGGGEAATSLRDLGVRGSQRCGDTPGR